MFRYSIMRSLRPVSTDANRKDNDDLPSNNNDNTQNLAAFPDDVLLLKRGYLLNDGSVLGEGTYSKVKRAYSKYEKRDVAVKIVNRKIAPRDFLKRFLPRELEVIGHVIHPNIIKFHEVFDIGDRVYIVMQHAEGGDLLEYIQKVKFIKEEAAKSMFLQIVSAVQYLHAMNVVHRDLKCENILLTKELKPLLSDFGFAKHLPDMDDLSKTYCGSSAYAPMEILKGIPYDGRTAEVWSLGCILYIVTTGSMPFDDSNKSEQMKQMKRGPTFVRSKQYLSETLKSLILSMLDNNATKRVKLEDVVKHTWLINVNILPLSRDVGRNDQ